MSEESIQRKILEKPMKLGDWNYYNFGATTIKQMLRLGIIPNKDYGKYQTKKVDAIIIQGKNNVIAVVEYKTPQELKSDFQIENTINQEIEVAKQLSKLYIITDTEKTIWINTKRNDRILNEKGEILDINFDYEDPRMYDIINSIIRSIDENNSQIKEIKRIDPSDLAHSIWQDVWSVSGASPENCLYTFVELFIFKYLSDLKVLNGMYSFYHLFQLYREGNSDEEILEYYAGTIRPKIKDLFPKGADNTTIINGTIFVSKDQKAVKGYSTVFKKILDRFLVYGILEDIDFDFKSKLFESFLKQSISKKNWGQFFTPLKVVKSLVKMADIKPGYKICDPACGVGKFLLEPMLREANNFFEIKDNKIISHIDFKGFDKGFDHDEQKTIILAKANMLIYLSDLMKKHPHMTTEFGKLFNETFELKTNSILGTLAEPSNDEYDLILTNPPYVMSGSSNLKEEIQKSNLHETYYKINAMGVEGLFIEWIVRALKPNGLAYIIVPDGVMNRNNDKKLRDFILNNCYINAVISLPKKTFFSTPKKTYILVLTKKQNKDLNGVMRLEKQNFGVFTYIVNSIGETLDINRFDISDNDLDDAVELYNQYKGLKDKERFNPNNIKCKIQSIDKFYNNDWLIDRWWTEKEKIEMNIINEENLLTLDEFRNNIADLSSALADCNEPIKVSKSTEKKLRDIFDFSSMTNSSFLTKKFVNDNKGDIPVYGASLNTSEASYGYIKDNLNGVKYFENCLTWNIDGTVGIVHNRKGKFVLSEKVIPLILKPEYQNLNKDYLKYEIEAASKKEGFEFGRKAGKSRIMDILINIPLKDNGDIDIEIQKKIANQYEEIDKLRKSLIEELQNSKIKIEYIK